MNDTARSIYVAGSDGIIIEIECHFSNGLPAIIIVGLGNKVVDESKERIRSAFASCKLKLPSKRITINLAPADIPKESTSFDLAIAAAIMGNALSQNSLRHDQAIIGEVALNGDVRPVRGLIGKLIAGKRLGISEFFIPAANLGQASLVPDIAIYPVENIKQLFLHLNQEEPIRPHEPRNTITATLPLQKPALSDIIGQEQAKRALGIAAAGGHNILLIGPPGTGKSMLAKALPSLMPPLTHQEILEVTHLHSLSSNNFNQLVATRPFRSPHHSASHTSMVGGGNPIRPGEITLSHSGILFLDELPEFNRATIEALRQPLEDHTITIARARQTVTFQASFILVATANPCPCGFYGSSTKECQCSPSRILAYQRKLSGPILDRIDLFVEVNTVEHTQLLVNQDNTTDNKIRDDVAEARSTQKKRFKEHSKLNADMDNEDIRRLSLLSLRAKELLNLAAHKFAMSPRSYMRVLKVSRTIADLEASATIESEHISEALQYRSLRMLQQ